MTFSQRWRRFLTSLIAVASLEAAISIRAQQIVYNNTQNSLDYLVAEPTEFGSELLLAGTARTITEIVFEYYGDFVQQGDERCKVRLYANEEPYDMYRKSPNVLLFESNTFPISPGYRTIRISGLNIPVRDVVTFTIEPKGLESGEGMGLLLYNPPTVGRSFNEFWRRNAEGTWEAVFYQFSRPEVKAKAAVRLTAINTVNLTTVKKTAEGKFRFGANGVNGADLLIECTKDFKTWTPIRTNSITGSFMVCEQDLDSPEGRCFFRVRVEK